MNAKESERPVENHRQDWGFWLWLAMATATLVLLTLIGTAAVVRHVMLGGTRLTEAWIDRIITTAMFPGRVKQALQDRIPMLNYEPTPLLISRQDIEETNWIRRFPSPDDSGYLLLSGLDPVAKKSIVQLIKIADGSVVHRWQPDWAAVNKEITSKQWEPKSSAETKRAMHPLLLENGDLIFNTGDALVRLGPCKAQPIWVVNEVVHHSVEQDGNGNIWAPTVTPGGFPGNTYLNRLIRDDALGLFSTQGQLIERRSFSGIMMRNGLTALLLGTAGTKINVDPIHMNQISVAKQDSKHWHRGDLLISARHLSTVFIYRPATDTIIWYKTGPWMNQHSADFVDDHRISVFNNNVVAASAAAKNAFVEPDGINEVMVFDFDTNQVSQPFAGLLAASQPKSITEGRAKVLEDGGLFIEDTNNGRHLRFTPEKLLWSRVNDYDFERVGIVSWSRYLSFSEILNPLIAINSKKCSLDVPSINNKVIIIAGK